MLLDCVVWVRWADHTFVDTVDKVRLNDLGGVLPIIHDHAIDIFEERRMIHDLDIQIWIYALPVWLDELSVGVNDFNGCFY